MIPRVMCVDDDSVTIMLCKIIIKKSLFSNDIVSADNGKTALDFFDDQFSKAVSERNLPSIIFLDLNMPIVDGWAFLDTFLERYSAVMGDIKVAVLSSSINPADAEKAKKYDCVLEFLPKPLDKEHLDLLKEHPSFVQFFK